MKKIIAMILMCIALAIPMVVYAAEPKDTYIREEYQEYIYEISEMYCVSPELIMAMIETESSGRANVAGGNGRYIGLMQIYEKYHRDRMDRLGVTDLYDPYSNILVGVDYLMELAREYGDDVALVLMKYNGSSDAEERSETGNYTKYASGIIARAEELTIIHEREREK